MKKSTKLMLTYENYRGLDCEALTKACTREADSVFFSTCGKVCEFRFSDDSSVVLSGATIADFHGDKVFHEIRHESFLGNFNWPNEDDYDECGKKINIDSINTLSRNTGGG